MGYYKEKVYFGKEPYWLEGITGSKKEAVMLKLRIKSVGYGCRIRERKQPKFPKEYLIYKSFRKLNRNSKGQDKYYH